MLCFPQEHSGHIMPGLPWYLSLLRGTEDTARDVKWSVLFRTHNRVTWCEIPIFNFLHWFCLLPARLVRPNLAQLSM